MRAYFNRLSFRARLAVGLSLIVGLMFFSDMMKAVHGGQGMEAVEHYFQVEDRVSGMAADSVVALEKARRLELEGLQRLRAGGDDAMRAQASRAVFDQLAVVRAMMAQVRALRGDPQTARRTHAVETYTLLFEHHFLRVAHLYGQLGHFSNNARQLDGILAQGGPPPAAVQALAGQLHAHEQQFLHSGAAREAAAVEAALARLRQAVQRAELPAARRQAMLKGLLGYSDAFASAVQILAEIDGATADYTAAALEIAPALAQLRDQSAAAQLAARERMRAAGGVAAVAAGLAWVVNLVAVLALCGWMLDGLRRWKDAALQFVQRIGAGDLSARMPEGRDASELAPLSHAMNAMAGSLQQGRDALAQRALHLEKANRALRILFHCNENMLRAPSEPDLLDAACRRLVDEGGYPLAWIGIPCHDDLSSIRPAAVATGDGVANPGIAALRFCWNGNREQRGLAGEALVSEQMVVVRAQEGSGRSAELGYAAGAALPLLWRGETLGVLVLYTDRTDVFDADELQLLQDLGMDLSACLAGLRDTLRRRLAEQTSDYQARHDGLTGLPGRSLLNERLQQAIVRAARDGKRVAVLVLGLDRYREVVSRFGAQAGNQLLKHAAQVLAAALRDGDTVARLLGDEFAVVAGGLGSHEDAMTVAAKLMAAVRQPVTVNGVALSTNASVGIGVHLRDGADAATLLCCANAAMVSAQAMGGNRMRYYAPELNERAARLAALDSDLSRALAEGGLAVHYQPRATLATGGIVAAQALLRWRHPVHGMAPPCEFIAAAERSGLIVELGRWVLRDVCRQLRAWREQGRPPVVVAVNLGARQFRDEGLVRDIRAALEAHGVAPQWLELEIPEATVMHRLDEAIPRLHALRAIGVRLTLEDFGADRSALGRLRELPVQSLKIGPSYVHRLADSPADAAVCGTIIALAHTLEMTVVAGGVESAGSAQALREQQCDAIQGHYVADALAPDDFAGMLARQAVMA